MMLVQILPKLPPGAKILFVRLRSLGDTLLTTPLFTALREWRPDLQLDVAVETPNDGVLLGNPHLREIISISQSRRGPQELLNRIKTVRCLRKEQYHCCINLHGGSTSAWLTALSGAPIRIGLSTFRNQWAYTHKIVPHLRGSRKLHTVENQIGWLHQLGLPKSEIPPLLLVIDNSAEEQVRLKLQAAGIGPKSRYCVIQPGSKFITKQWPAERFGSVATFLFEEYGMKTVITGNRQEIRVLSQVAAHMTNHAIIEDSLTVQQLGALLKNAHLFIGNDSGPTHMAAALQIPTVVLFGSSDSRAWHPWKAPYRLVQNQFNCNPCPGYKCLIHSDPQCILSITPDQVMTAIDNFRGSQFRLSNLRW